MTHQRNNINMLENRDIAIIGMAFRFPGSNDVYEFWKNLVQGKESTTFFSDDRLLEIGISPSTLQNPDYVKTSTIINDIDKFDAQFFNVTPREAKLMDPQFRLLLECAWEALENSSYIPEKYKGYIGIYGGCYIPYYLINNLVDLVHEKMVKENDFDSLYQSISDFLTSNIAYKLNLKGPSISVQTWCTTSLTAIHLACQGLRNNDCDIALAGGVQLRIPQGGYFYYEGSVDSADGVSRSFDMDAQGTVPGNGLGILVLKKLNRALKDGDYIHAIIKGSSVNNDGSGTNKLSYHGTTIAGQIRAMKNALANADVDADSISYIEAHGGATDFSDRLELTALSKVFHNEKEPRKKKIIGSVKPNVGHLGVASGMASIIKTVLALKNRKIPATVNFKTLNPKIKLKNNSFYVNDRLIEWESSNQPLRASINGYGVGGTNVHIVLEEAPSIQTSRSSLPWHLIPLSAKTPTALNKINENLSAYLQNHQKIEIADVAFTLGIGRKAFSHRKILVCRDIRETITKISATDSNQRYNVIDEFVDRAVVFMFPGYGEQYINMTQELYESSSLYRKFINQCFEIIYQKSGVDLHHILFASNEEQSASTVQFNKPTVSGAALFSVEYALAKQLMELGIYPDAMLGYSNGEFVAACLAGVMTLEEALTMIIEQTALIETLPSGRMMAVPLAENDLRPLLADGLSIAAVNSPISCVVSGCTRAVDKLQLNLKKQNIECLRLNSSYAFHSEMMEPILGQISEIAKKIKISAPQIPLISCVTGNWIKDDFYDPNYWAMKIRQPVLFEKGLRHLLKNPDQILLEVGPRQTLSLLARQHSGKNKKQIILPTLPHLQGEESEMECLFTNIGKLWLNGIDIDWTKFYHNEARRRLPLPTYPFERKRYWIDPRQSGDKSNSTIDELEKKPNIADWFYIPIWKQKPNPVVFDGEQIFAKKYTWLIFINNENICSRFVRKLIEAGQTIISIQNGSNYSQLGENDYCLDSSDSRHYDQLFQELQKDNKIPEKIVHFWNFTDSKNFDELQNLGFYSLINIAKALGEIKITTGCFISVVSNHLQKVIGNEYLCPAKATLLGPIKTIPKEYPNINCSNIDITTAATDGDEEQLINNLLNDTIQDSHESYIAYREENRWEQSIEPVRLERKNALPSRLRQEGVYLITGGLGDIGLVLAEYLAKNARAKLILTSHSTFPSRESWDSYIKNNSGDKKVRKKILKIKELQEKYNTEILVQKADVASEQEMQQVITSSIKRFNQINGIIHLAGKLGGGIIQLKKSGDGDEVLAPKIQGTEILFDLSKDLNLDFIILNSSTASFLGPYGLVDYTAANAFMDAFCTMISSNNGTYTVSINWDMWSEVGMGINSEVPGDIKKLREENRKYGILSHEGVDVFNRILFSNLNQIIVSTRDFSKMGSTKFYARLHEIDNDLPAIDLQSRPDLPNKFIGPGTEIEKDIAKMWCRLFGVEEVGIRDNFFSLGGHSLLAMMLLNKLRLTYSGVALTLQILFDNPTVEDMARLIETSKVEEPKNFDYSVRKQIIKASPQERYTYIENYLKRKFAENLNIEIDEIKSESNLNEFNWKDIISQLHLDLKEELILPLYEYEIAEKSSLKELAEYIKEEFELKEGLKYIEKPTVNSNFTDKPKQIISYAQKIEKPVIFLHSAPRSGSTLFRLMLAGHSSLFCPPETWLLLYDDLHQWNRNVPGHVKQHGGLLRSIKELDKKNPDEANEVLSDLVNKNLSVQDVYRLIQEKSGEKILVDKCPRYSADIAVLEKAEKMFENAKYIHLVRHPYAMIESSVRVRLHTLGNNTIEDPYIYAEEVWFNQNSNLLRYCQNLNQDQYLLIRFEDLVKNPKHQMEIVCDFLDIHYEDALLHPYRGNRMIDGDGDPNIFNHNTIDAGLGVIWKKIKLPHKLRQSTQALVSEFNYELPAESTRPTVIETKEIIEKTLSGNITEKDLEHIDDLSNDQVEEILNSLLTKDD